MSFDNLPSKAEVTNWDPQHLAEFLRKRDLTGCDKVVVKCGINGQRFLSLSTNDLQKFPKLHAPLISRISREINKKEEKRSFFPLRSSTQKFTEPVDVPQEDQGWDSEEFESDDDYENPNSNDDDDGSVEDYETADSGRVDSDNDYEPPPSEPPDDLHHQICPAKPMTNSEYIDRSSVKSQPPMPPARPGPGPGSCPQPQASARPNIGGTFPRAEAQSLHKPPPLDRSKKPSGTERGCNSLGSNLNSSYDRTTTPPWRNAAVEKPPEPPRMAKPPLPTGVRRSASSVTPSVSFNRDLSEHRNELHDNNAKSSYNTFPHARNPSPRPPLHGHGGSAESFNKPACPPFKMQDAINNHRSSSRTPQHPMRPSDQDTRGGQDMDPAWYVGRVTRSEAEGSLRHANRDGAFLVRDSSKGSVTQPYTLMVLYQSKVYNIQIRVEQNSYVLGTGLKSCEPFANVSDIIKQHKQMPLLLIDAKSRGTGQQNQCTLTYPAGF